MTDEIGVQKTPSTPLLANTVAMSTHVIEAMYKHWQHFHRTECTQSIFTVCMSPQVACLCDFPIFEIMKSIKMFQDWHFLWNAPIRRLWIRWKENGSLWCLRSSPTRTPAPSSWKDQDECHPAVGTITSSWLRACPSHPSRSHLRRGSTPGRAKLRMTQVTPL